MRFITQVADIIALLGIELSISRIDTALTLTIRYKKTHKHNGGLIYTDNLVYKNQY